MARNHYAISTSYAKVADGTWPFPPYPGGFIQLTIIDVRKYPRAYRWKDPGGPFRIYATGYDDWNAERRYQTRREAREAVKALVAHGALTYKVLFDKGFRSL
jgi:hypothetical protein